MDSLVHVITRANDLLESIENGDANIEIAFYALEGILQSLVKIEFDNINSVVSELAFEEQDRKLGIRLVVNNLESNDEN
jgi:hypothetical protein|tara:strand:- start:671 stop:907 length:237 start_codon:yes stop_codon:yes gene_type:complete